METNERHVEAEIAAALRCNTLFESLQPAEIAELISLGAVVSYPADTLLFNKGDPGDCMYVVLEGDLGVFTISDTGKKVVLNFVRTGEILGEIALIDGGERTAAVTTIKKTRLFRLSRTAFLPFLERYPKVCTHMLVALVARLRYVSAKVEDVMFLTPANRLAKRLLALAEQEGEKSPHGVRLVRQLSQEAMGQMVGVSREMVNRYMKSWTDSGVLKVEAGRVTILDMEQMRQVATVSAD